MIRKISGPPKEVMSNQLLLNTGIWKCFLDLSLDCEPVYDSKNKITSYLVKKDNLVAGLEQKKDELANGIAALLSQGENDVFHFLQRVVSE